MQGYAAQVPTPDRWAIAAYVRALQLSQHAVLAEWPPATRAALLEDATATAATGSTTAGHGHD